MNEKKKALVPTIVAVVTLIALVAGATYAYFAVGTTNNFGTANINATAESVGTVALNAGSDLSLSVTAVDMMAKFNEETPVDVNYYATVGTTDPNHTNDSTPVTIGSATVTGTGTFNCSYTLEVTPSYTGETARSSMLQQLNGMVSPEPTTGQLILYVNGTSYDLYTLVHNNNLSDVVGSIVKYEIPGTFTGISESTNTGSTKNLITAQLKLVNLGGTNPSVANSQNDLAGTNLNLQIRVKDNSLTCTAVDAPVTPASITYYWTSNGSNVTYDTASPKYTDANKSQMTNNYYIKTVAEPTVAADDIYEIQSTSMGNSGDFGVTFSSEGECNESITSMNVTDGICAVKYAKNETYEVTTHEVCGVFTNEVCFNANEYYGENQTAANASAIMDKMKAAGATYCNEETYSTDGYVACSPIENGWNTSGAFYCIVYSSGNARCGVRGTGLCDVNTGGDAVCYA